MPQCGETFMRRFLISKGRPLEAGETRDLLEPGALSVRLPLETPGESRLHLQAQLARLHKSFALCFHSLAESALRQGVGFPSQFTWTLTCLDLHRLFAPVPARERRPSGGTQMSTASETHSSERAVSDREFEELLQRTWEFMQNHKEIHPLDSATESPSWT